jgi:hypothetical protein
MTDQELCAELARRCGSTGDVTSEDLAYLVTITTALLWSVPLHDRVVEFALGVCEAMMTHSDAVREGRE